MVRIGQAYEFSPVAYYFYCSTGCFENRWLLGEFLFRLLILTRGFDDTDVSVLPSKRYAIFADEPGKFKVFDAVTQNNRAADGWLAGEVKRFKWSEAEHKVTVDYYEKHPSVEIKLPEQENIDR